MKGFDELKKIEDDPTQGPEALARQYLMNLDCLHCGGLIDDASRIIWVPRKGNGRYSSSVIAIYGSRSGWGHG